MTDHRGTWISASIPVEVTTKTPHFVMLSVDVDAAGWSECLGNKLLLPTLLALFFLLVLIGIITRSQRIEKMFKHLSDFTSELSDLAYYDALTALPNRRLLDDRALQAFKAAKRAKQMVAIMFLDLDYFKAVNDGYGHQVR